MQLFSKTFRFCSYYIWGGFSLLEKKINLFLPEMNNLATFIYVTGKIYLHALQQGIFLDLTGK